MTEGRWDRMAKWLKTVSTNALDGLDLTESPTSTSSSTGWSQLEVSRHMHEWLQRQACHDRLLGRRPDTACSPT